MALVATVMVFSSRVATALKLVVARYNFSCQFCTRNISIHHRT